MHQHIGRRVNKQAKLIGFFVVATGTIGFERVLMVFDHQFHFAAATINYLGQQGIDAKIAEPRENAMVRPGVKTIMVHGKHRKQALRIVGSSEVQGTFTLVPTP